MARGYTARDVLIGLMVSAAVVVAFIFAAGVLMPDSCLDRGGCWDAQHERCEFQNQSLCTPPK